MTVDPEKAAGKWDYQGTTYYFCNPHCREKFIADPDKYLNPQGAPKPAKDPAADLKRDSGQIYTCPMDPEVRQIGPGPCPKCGMALEPMTVERDGRENPELADMQRRFWVSLALTAPILLSGHGGNVRRTSLACRPSGCSLPCRHRWCSGEDGLSFSAGGLSIVNRSLNMFTLIAIGTGIAYVYSVVAVLFPGWLPHSFQGHGGMTRRVLRSGRGHHYTRSAGAGARTQSPEPDEQRNPGTPGSGTQDGTPGES